MKLYYKERAPVYDRVYSYPERQADLRELEQYIPTQFHNKELIEIAAGTGYWTQYICHEAKSILATDITKEALRQINGRDKMCHNVTTKILDAYALNLSQQFNAAFAGLWYSHIPIQQIPSFFTSLHQCLSPGATVIFIDNSIAQCERLPLCFTDKNGNTYQDRTLDNGHTHRVLKNFPTKEQLITSVENFGDQFIYKQYKNYWLFQYTAL